MWVATPSIVSYVKKFNIVRHKLRVRRGSLKFRAWQEAPEGSTGAPVLSAAAPEPQSGAEWGSEPLQEEPEPEGRYLWVGYFHLSSLFFFFFFFTQPGTWNPHFNRKLKLDSGPRWRWILKNVLKIRPASGKNVELMSCCHVSHETWVLIMCLPPRLWTQRSPLRSKPEGETHYENVSCCVVMQRVGPEPRHVALKKKNK